MLRGVVSLSETPSQENNTSSQEKEHEKENEKGNEEKHERETTTPSIMILDAVTLKNLDILPDPTNPSLHSLFAYIDHRLRQATPHLLALPTPLQHQ